MRVIGGQLRSRLLVAPSGSLTRPTSDRLRETLFNVLGPRLVGAHIADLYAGSGAVGIEGLSRGAASCLFVETASKAILALKRNISTLQLLEQTAVDARPVQRALRGAAQQARRFDLIFLDPPYAEKEEYSATLTYLSQHRALLKGGALVVAEHARRSPLPASFGELTRHRLLEQGDAALSFYAVREVESELER